MMLKPQALSVAGQKSGWTGLASFDPLCFFVCLSISCRKTVDSLEALNAPCRVMDFMTAVRYFANYRLAPHFLTIQNPT
jgi:hypothetical protein